MSRSAVTVDTFPSVRRMIEAAPVGESLQAIGLREVVIGRGALDTLPEILARLGVASGAVVTLLSDDVPKAGPGGDVLDLVTALVSKRHTVSGVVVEPGPGATVVHADEATVDLAVDRVRATAADLLVTVGSGTVADIGKVVAQRLDIAHVIVQTAASVNGFADDQSVLLRSGTKRTTPSRWPEVVVIDADVVAAAPPAMTRSGLGDQISMFTACADWYLSSLVGFDRTFSATAWQVLRAGSAPVLGSGARLAAGDRDAVLGLAMALTRGGLAMGIAGRTSPSSGTEHMVSHLLDMRSHAEQRPDGRHGAQVGVGSVVAASIWEAMRSRLGSGGQVVRPLPVDVMRQRVEDAFLVLDPSGAVAKECWSAYERKLTWINEHLPKLQAICDDWAGCDPAVGELLASPTTLATTLRQAGGASRFAELDPAPSEATARWALANGHLMRDRFTIVDLAEVTGNWSAGDVDRMWAATQGVP